LFSPRKTFLPGESTVAHAIRGFKQAQKVLCCLKRHTAQNKKHFDARSIFLVACQNLCYQLSVTHEFSHEAFQHYVSPYKFFRLLEYTASYF